MNSETDDEFVLLLEVNYHGDYSVQTIFYQSFESFRVSDISNQLAEEYELDANQVWLVYRGRKLRDDELVKNVGLEDYSRLFLGVSGADHLTKPIRTGLPAAPAKPLPIKRSDVVTKTTNDPFTDIISENPDLVFEMLQANPKLKIVMDRNPQIRHALSDPNTLKEILQTQSNPKMFQEAMRGHDRALANIENVPGGFQALQQFYTKELADVEEGIGGLAVGDSVKSKRYENKNERNIAPMPNPWRKNMSVSSKLSSSTTDMVNSETDLSTYETRFREQLRIMQEMGFTDTKANIRALLATGGNVNSAIERLLNNLL